MAFSNENKKARNWLAFFNFSKILINLSIEEILSSIIPKNSFAPFFNAKGLI
jgi:hypothetical protein